MQNSNSSAGTAADSSTQPIAHSSADIEANPLLNVLAVSVEPLTKAEPCLIQSAFLLDNGKRIIVFTSSWTGISSFECDEDWKEFPKPFATCPLNMVTGSLTDYHKRIREMHGLDKLVKEHSTVIDW